MKTSIVIHEDEDGVTVYLAEAGGPMVTGDTVGEALEKFGRVHKLHLAIRKFVHWKLHGRWLQ